MIVACPHCGQKNRLNVQRLPEGGECGKCHGVLGAPDHPIDADPALFDAVLSGSSLPVLVDFWAPWCGPCLRAAPEVAKAAKAMQGTALVLKVDTQKHPSIAARFGIQGIPYFAVFRDGTKRVDQTGLVGAPQLQALVARSA